MTMNSADLKLYKERLMMLRSRLRNDVTSMTDAALHNDGSETSTMPIHMAELGSDNFEQEFTLSLLATEEDTLGMIESALERIESGNYGTCEECNGSIPKTRLNALPHTPVCVKCAATRDARELAG
jgi:DnaK suppressor protein